MNLANITVPSGSEWAVLVLGYLLGSVPFGYVFARLRGIDLRQVGSGNIGATNTGRAIGRPLGLLAFFLDFAKGWAPAALFVPWFATSGEGDLSLAVLGGAAAVCGHVWPIYIGFRGGKAVATGCGAIVALDPMIFVLGGVAWILTALGTGFVSLASLVMALTFPLVAWQRVGSAYGYEVVWATVAFAALVFWRHKANLKRLFSGVEPRWRPSKTEPKDD